jgi:crotonobetainyl-CoA:carnitine CoA-transferase CaiB-like acyl-CoA transferase
MLTVPFAAAPLAGVRVLEVASWVFVPSAGAVLADWGADVVKVEHPGTGDPVRGLVTQGLLAGGPGREGAAINYMFEQVNRGKRSVGINLAEPRGRSVLYQLAARSDVFLTNLLPDDRQKLEIGPDDIQAHNPRIVYVKGTGQGSHGPDAARGGMDFSSFWARGGLATAITPPGADYPVGQPPALGDLFGGLATAGAVGAALYHRNVTGEGCVIDVSLLATALWGMSPSVVASKYYDDASSERFDRYDSPNPVTRVYRTSDRRFINLNILQADRYWRDFCEHIDRPDLVEDPRFCDERSRFANRDECVQILQDVFERHDQAYWKQRLSSMAGVWAPVQSAREVHDDPQAQSNGYIVDVHAEGRGEIALVSSPAQFNGIVPELQRAPEHGEHTEEILLELGHSWADVAELKDIGAVL